MKLYSALIFSCLGAVILAQEPTPLTPKALQAALAQKPEGPDAEKLAERLLWRKREPRQRRSAEDRRTDGRMGSGSAATGREHNTARRRRCGRTQPADGESRHDGRLGGCRESLAWRGYDVALRARTRSSRGRVAARGLRDASGQPRATRCAERRGQADAAVAK